MKKCIKCGKIKTKNNFYKGRKMKDGTLNTCKKCFCKYISLCQNKRDKENKNKYGIGRKTISCLGLKLALLVYDRAKRKCENCGEINNLTVHHKDRKGSNNFKKGLPQNNHPDNLIVLCRSCHGSIHGKQSKEYWDRKGRLNSEIDKYQREYYWKNKIKILKRRKELKKLKNSIKNN